MILETQMQLTILGKIVHMPVPPLFIQDAPPHLVLLRLRLAGTAHTTPSMDLLIGLRYVATIFFLLAEPSSSQGRNVGLFNKFFVHEW